MQSSSASLTRRQHLPISIIASCVAAASLMLAFATADDDTLPRAEPSSGPGMLQPLNSVVGSWRGMGQPKRGSRRGAWQEQLVCRWDFANDQPAIRFDSDQGRQYQQLTLTADSASNQLVLHQQTDKDTVRVYRGAMPKKWPARLQLSTSTADDGSCDRCTITQLSDIRLVMLFEHRTSEKGSFRRTAGIGYTRSGHRLAQTDGNQRECIVTGGKGTIKVTHQGKTWYVCCEGCRQAFEDSPDEIIAAFLERQNEQPSAP